MYIHCVCETYIVYVREKEGDIYIAGEGEGKGYNSRTQKSVRDGGGVFTYCCDVCFSYLSVSELRDEARLPHTTVPTQQYLHQTVVVPVHPTTYTAVQCAVLH